MTTTSPDDAVPPPLEIPSEILGRMVDHCRRDAPLEACGILAGLGTLVTTFHPLRNAARSESLYKADERDLIAAVREIREGGREILALYHSHPRWEPIPSRTDLLENHWGDVPRIIVGLLGNEPDVRVWRLRGDSFVELPWTVLE